MAKGEISRKRKESGLKRNREAISGKMALMASWEQCKNPDYEYMSELVGRITRQRAYLKNRIGDDE